MAITNPNRVVKVSQLNYFKTKADALYQTKAISAITGLSAETVEAALAELLGKIQAIPSAIIPKGTRTFSQLDPSTDLVAGSLGFMWNISDAFTTDSNFAEGSGKAVAAGSNIYVANVGTAAEPSYKYDIFAGPIDLSGYALKSEMSVTPGTGTDADKTTIQLKTGTSATVLTAHQDISGKADKVSSATSGNFAGLDGNGNLTDSGSKASDFATAAQGALADSAYQKPSGGIPDTDLSSDVQTSLGKADSAYQKPSGGIPDTDLSSDVQTSLGKADSAIQSVALAGGTNNGTVKLTVDGTATDNIAVTGLGTAAYKADTYFEPAITYAENADIDEMFA